MGSVLGHKTLRDNEPPLDDLVGMAMPCFVLGLVWGALLRAGGGLERTGLALRIVASAIALVVTALYVAMWSTSIVYVGAQALAVPIFVAAVVAWTHHRAATCRISPGEQRESRVGAMIAGVAAAAAVLLVVMPEEACAYGNGIEAIGVVCTPHGTDSRDSFGMRPVLVPELARDDRLARIAELVLACVGGALGAAGFFLARRRRKARHAFLRDVEAGGVSGFRLRDVDGEKIVVRVDGSVGDESYRVAHREVPIFRYRM